MLAAMTDDLSPILIGRCDCRPPSCRILASITDIYRVMNFI